MYKLNMNTDYNGKYFNLDFVNGQTETDNMSVVNYFIRHNLSVEEVKQVVVEEKNTTKKNTKAKKD